MKLFLLLALVAIAAATEDDPHMLSDEFMELVRGKAKTWTVSVNIIIWLNLLLT